MRFDLLSKDIGSPLARDKSKEAANKRYPFLSKYIGNGASEAYMDLQARLYRPERFNPEKSDYKNSGHTIWD